MLKTNSKQVKNKINKYLYDSFTDYDQKEAEGRSLQEVLEYIAEGIASEKLSCDKSERAARLHAFYKGSIYNVIKDYAQGLGSLFDCDYYYRCCARDLVGDILEQTKEEREKYSEDQAEDLMTLLIYRALDPYIEKAIY